MTKLLDYTPSAAHAERAKLGEHVGRFLRAAENRPAHVPHSWGTITKVWDDGRIRVTDNSGRHRTLKPYGRRNNRYVWSYIDREQYKALLVFAVQTDKDRERTLADIAEHEREMAQEDADREAQLARNLPLYDQLIRYANENGVLLKLASSGQCRFRAPRYDDERHDSREVLLPSLEPEANLGEHGFVVPHDMFLALLNAKG